MTKDITPEIVRHPSFIRSFIRPATDASFLTGLTGLVWDYLWLGRDTDTIQKEVLVQQGSAQQGVPATGLKQISSISDAAWQFADGTTDAWQAQTADIGEFDGTPILIATIGRTLEGRPTVARNLVGKRESIAPFMGWEQTLLTNGGILARIDWGGGMRDTTLNADHADTDWHAMVLRDMDGSVQVWSELGAGSLGTSAGDASTATLLSAGKNRLLAAGVDMAWLGIATGAQVSNIDGQVLANTLFDKLVEVIQVVADTIDVVADGDPVIHYGL